MVLVVMRRRCSSEAAVAASSTRFTRCPVLAEMKTMLAHSMGRSCRGGQHEGTQKCVNMSVRSS